LECIYLGKGIPKAKPQGAKFEGDDSTKYIAKVAKKNTKSKTSNGGTIKEDEEVEGGTSPEADIGNTHDGGYDASSFDDGNELELAAGGLEGSCDLLMTLLGDKSELNLNQLLESETAALENNATQSLFSSASSLPPLELLEADIMNFPSQSTCEVRVDDLAVVNLLQKHAEASQTSTIQEQQQPSAAVNTVMNASRTDTLGFQILLPQLQQSSFENEMMLLQLMQCKFELLGWRCSRANCPAITDINEPIYNSPLLPKLSSPDLQSLSMFNFPDFITTKATASPQPTDVNPSSKSPSELSTLLPQEQSVASHSSSESFVPSKFPDVHELMTTLSSTPHQLVHEGYTPQPNFPTYLQQAVSKGFKQPWLRTGNEREARELIDSFFNAENQIPVSIVHKHSLLENFETAPSILM
jgi:hypothetical protein